MKKTTEQFKKEVYDLVDNEYTVLGEYTKNKNKILMRHNKCGHEYEVTPNHFLDGRRCPKCSRLKTTEQFKKEVYDLVDNEYTVLGEYTGRDSKILMRHNKCGHEYEVAPHYFIRGTRCPYCAGNRKRTNKEFLEEINILDKNNEYEILSEYKNNSDYIEIKHKTCGNIYKVRPYNFKAGHRCPYCSNSKGFSKYEKEIISYIEKILSKSNKNVKIAKNSKNIIKPYELDIYLEELNIAIEFDGLYWHSDLFKDNNYHLMKTEMCNLKNIKLIHIFEDEWLYKKDLVKDKLKTLLGLNTVKIYARECYIKEISSKDKNIFLEENHIQGKDVSSIRLGLYTSSKYYEEEVLVAVMTFCKPRKALGQNKDSLYDYELSRYCSMLGYNILGGFSKLLKYFERNYNWSRIITYADRRWSNGNLYLKNNFKLLHTSKPNYWYTTCNLNNRVNRYHRYGFRKSEIKKKFPNIYDDNKTESEMMRELGYLRIYDCGNLVFSYTRKE